jgi:hypothetical protein
MFLIQGIPKLIAAWQEISMTGCLSRLCDGGTGSTNDKNPNVALATVDSSFAIMGI